MSKYLSNGCSYTSFAKTSNHHFYTVNNDIYKYTYNNGNTCMKITPGGSVKFELPCNEKDINRMSEKQIKEFKKQSIDEEIDADIYAYEKEHRHLAQSNIRRS